MISYLLPTASQLQLYAWIGRATRTTRCTHITISSFSLFPDHSASIRTFVLSDDGASLPSCTLSLFLSLLLSIRLSRSDHVSLSPSARDRRLAVITRTRLCNRRLVTANRRLFTSPRRFSTLLKRSRQLVSLPYNYNATVLLQTSRMKKTRRDPTDCSERLILILPQDFQDFANLKGLPVNEYLSTWWLTRHASRSKETAATSQTIKRYRL